MNFFLRAKHWQVFLLFFGVPLMFYAGFFLIILQNVANSDFIGPSELYGNNFMIIFLVAILISLTTLLGWHWAITQEFQKSLPENIRVKSDLSKFTILFPAVYIIFIALSTIQFFSDSYMFDFNLSPDIFIYIIPFHFLSMFCFLYNMYKSAKIIKSAELQRTAHFSDYAGEIFMIWFFMIGIWILQPKINRIFRENNPEDMSGRFNALDTNV